MNHMHREILSAPELLEGTICENIQRVEALAKALKEKAYPTVHIAARGSSANAGLYFAYACEILAGLPVHMLMPSVLTVYDGQLCFGDGLLLAITQGGRGSDIRFLMEAAKAQGCHTAAICNEEDSPIAREADTLLPMKLGIEQAMAATKTFTAELLLGSMLALALAVALTKEFKLANFLRGMFFLPYIMSMTIVGFIWKFIFTQGFEKLYELTGWGIWNLSWLGDGGLAFWSLVIVGTWQSLGFYIVLYIAGLQAIPKEVMEAASIDGATGSQRFFRVTLPLLGPSITTCMFMSLTNSLKVK